MEVAFSLIQEALLQLLAKRGGGAEEGPDRVQGRSVHVWTVGHQSDNGRHQVKLCRLSMAEEHAISGELKQLSGNDA